MKRVLYLIRRPPGQLADETTDLMLVSGVFEQPTAVVFMDDGVLQLAGLARRRSPLKALPTYEVESLYAEAASLEARGLDAGDIELDVEVIGGGGIARLIERHDVVLTD